ncbi:MAG: hypothetical protein AB7J46_01300 [Candidatus Altimarinota bacterium]
MKTQIIAKKYGTPQAKSADKERSPSEKTGSKGIDEKIANNDASEAKGPIHRPTGKQPKKKREQALFGRTPPEKNALHAAVNRWGLHPGRRKT